jgi:8-hydroxy-5-deazaflavin:NADPH oxidoreductase
MKIGILGAGNIGGNLGKGWAAAGHEIVFGVRDPQSEKTTAAIAAAGPNARATSMREAVEFGEVVALAVPWQAVADALAEAGDLGGKTLIDCTNRLGPLAPGSAASSSEDVARLAPSARVVKAFNTFGYESLADPRYGALVATAFIAGDDERAKSTVARLAQDLGFEVEDAGPLANAALLESLTRLWIQLARTHGRTIAFALLRR